MRGFPSLVKGAGLKCNLSVDGFLADDKEILCVSRFVGSNPSPRIIVMKFDKLVRDKYPEILGKKGKFRTADEEEYKQKLREKIVEEAEELQGSVSKEELADVLEAIECYIEAEK